MNYRNLPEQEKNLVIALVRMVDQYTHEDYDTGLEPYTPGQRTTMPYSCLSNAVWVLKDYGVVDVIGYVGRVVTFIFIKDALDWAYGLPKK